MDFELTLAEAFVVIKSLGYLVLGVTAYSIFIFNFYRMLGRKDIFKLDLRIRNKTRFVLIVRVYRTIIHLAKYITYLPAISVFWFAVLVVILAFIAKSRSVDVVLQIAVTIVAATRVAAYYNEDLAKDLAKMLPFALLGIFLVDPSYISLGVSMETLQDIGGRADTVAYYLVAVIALEYALRIVDTIVRFAIRMVRKIGARSPLPVPGPVPQSE